MGFRPNSQAPDPPCVAASFSHCLFVHPLLLLRVQSVPGRSCCWVSKALDRAVGHCDGLGRSLNLRALAIARIACDTDASSLQMWGVHCGEVPAGREED